jgi:hypothetical protein
MMDGFTCDAQYLYGNPIPNMKKHPPFLPLEICEKNFRGFSGSIVSSRRSRRLSQGGDGNFRELSTKKM